MAQREPWHLQRTRDARLLDSSAQSHARTTTQGSDHLDIQTVRFDKLSARVGRPAERGQHRLLGGQPRGDQGA